MGTETFFAITQAAERTFIQLTGAVEKLTNEEYTTACKVLFNATIGQHVRHIAELFIELEKGYNCGTVNYEKRNRDYNIETNKQFALNILHDIYLNLYRPGKNLLLEGNYNETGDTLIAVPTNYYREVIYNIEHTVHHMALIRIGISSLSNIVLPGSFGIAPATLKHREVCAQ